MVKPAYCTTRVATAQTLGAIRVSMTIFPHAQHTFDQALSVTIRWTQADVDAKKAGDVKAMKFFAAYLP